MTEASCLFGRPPQIKGAGKQASRSRLDVDHWQVNVCEDSYLPGFCSCLRTHSAIDPLHARCISLLLSVLSVIPQLGRIWLC